MIIFEKVINIAYWKVFPKLCTILIRKKWTKFSENSCLFFCRDSSVFIPIAKNIFLLYYFHKLLLQKYVWFIITIFWRSFPIYFLWSFLKLDFFDLFQFGIGNEFRFCNTTFKKCDFKSSKSSIFISQIWKNSRKIHYKLLSY